MNKIPTRLKSEWLWLGGILALTALVYLQATGFAFVFDDLPQIVSNPYITSWHSVPSYFGGELWSNGWAAGVYRPLMMFWLLLNRLAFGLDPRWWHLACILLHVVVTFLLFRLTLHLTRSQETAVLAALIFGLHPVHIESVVWVSAVGDPLVALFLLFALWVCIRYQTTKRMRNLLWSLAAFTIALLTKEVAILFPVIVFAYAAMQPAAQPIPSEAAKSKPARQELPQELHFSMREGMVLAWPFALVAIVYVCVRSAVLHGFTALTSLSLSTVLFTIPSVLVFYLRHLVWPDNLSLFYDSYYVIGPSLDFWLPSLVLVLVAVAMWVLARKTASRMIAFGSLWMLLTILPALNFTAFHWREIAHDRYLYLPSIGFAIIVAVLIGELARTTRIVLTVFLAGALFAGTFVQLSPWATPFLLYYHTVKVAPNNIAAVILLADEVKSRGQIEQAEELYARATKLAPNWSEAWEKLGETQYLRQEYQPAEYSLLRATAIDSHNARAFYLLGIVRMQTGHWPEAEVALRTAVALEPGQQDFQQALTAVLAHQQAQAGSR